MANLRIVYDNAADRGTITTSTTAGTLVAGNLKTDLKSEVWRSTATTATITVEWSAAEMVNMVALPHTSLTSSATIRVQGYALPTDTTPVFDTGARVAVPSSFDTFGWGTLPLGVNAYSYGGGTTGATWFSTRSVRKIVVTLTDTQNPNGYIEASRLVTGNYWSPQYNAEYGATVTPADMSRHERSEAGDLRTERGARYRVINVDLTMMPATDRNAMWRILWGNGMAKPIFFSLTPESTDATEEQIFHVYGKLSRMASIKYQFLNQFNTTLELEEL